MRHTLRVYPTVLGICFLLLQCLLLTSAIALSASDYAYTDPETGVVYYSLDEPGGVYTTGLSLTDYRQTVFEDMWGKVSPPPAIPVDLDLDGNLDLVFALGLERFDDRTGELGYQANLAYCLGDGTGHFLSTEILLEDILLFGYAVSDVNHDGLSDIVAIVRERYTNPHRLVVLLQQPDGAFEQDILMQERVLIYPAFMDVTGDGNVDIVCIEMAGDLVAELLTFVGDGQGGFLQPVGSLIDFPVSVPSSLSESPQDFNGDGRADACLLMLLKQDELADYVILIGYGQEDGTFEYVIDQSLGDYVPRSAFESGDFNGDGAVDIAIQHGLEGSWLRREEETDRFSGYISIHYNNGKGRFEKEVVVDFQVAGVKPLTADVDGDGYDDLMSFDANGSVAVWLGSNSRTNTQVDVYTCQAAPNTRVWLPFVGDFNNDELCDIGANMMEPVLGVRFGDGLGGFGTGWFSPPVDSPTRPLSALADFVADFDGDGNLDLVQYISTDVSVAFGDGTGRFPEIVPVLFARDIDEWALAAGDVNGDGADDLLLSSRSNREAGIRLFWGGADREFSEGAPVAKTEWNAWVQDITISDINKDGHVDLLYGLDGVLRASFGDGTGTFLLHAELGGRAVLNAPDSAIYDYWLTDTNQDGYVDIITGTSELANKLWLNDGRNQWTCTEEHGFVAQNADREKWEAAPDWVRIPSIGMSYTRTDVDQDGLSDFVTINDSVLEIALTDHEQALLKFCAQGHGEPVRVHNPLAADVNGDGWLDLITASREFISVIFNRLSKVLP